MSVFSNSTPMTTFDISDESGSGLVRRPSDVRPQQLIYLQLRTYDPKGTMDFVPIPWNGDRPLLNKFFASH